MTTDRVSALSAVPITYLNIKYYPVQLVLSQLTLLHVLNKGGIYKNTFCTLRNWTQHMVDLVLKWFTISCKKYEHCVLWNAGINGLWISIPNSKTHSLLTATESSLNLTGLILRSSTVLKPTALRNFPSYPHGGDTPARYTPARYTPARYARERALVARQKMSANHFVQGGSHIILSVSITAPSSQELP